MMTISKLERAASAFAIAVATPALADEPTYDKPVAIDLTFVTHVEADMPEQDVFIEKEPGSGDVYRATKGERDLAQPIFTAAEPQPHQPFDVEALGPFDKGASLDMSLADWLAASGSGTYACEDGQATIDVSFDNLVPEGVYTMWHFFMASPPTEPFIGTYDLPMGSRDGTDSVFTADAEGKARFQRSFKPCLQLSGEHLMGGLAVAWHSDGKTYGVEPGEFAMNSHIQLFLGLPKRAGI